jgi:hypothetical protein
MRSSSGSPTATDPTEWEVGPYQSSAALSYAEICRTTGWTNTKYGFIFRLIAILLSWADQASASARIASKR